MVVCGGRWYGMWGGIELLVRLILGKWILVGVCIWCG